MDEKKCLDVLIEERKFRKKEMCHFSLDKSKMKTYHLKWDGESIFFN